MSILSQFSRGFAASLSLGLCLILARESVGQTVATVPVGAVTVTIAAGSGTARALTFLSFPLMADALASGQTVGTITSVTSNTISNSSAGWTPSALSIGASPYVIQITSGTAKGYTFLVSTTTANTDNTVTLDAEESGLVNLTNLGIIAGIDTYRLVPCDTLSSVLGTPLTTGVQGGSSSVNADIVQVLVQGAYRQYYYNTTSGAWLRVGPNTNSNNLPIRPDTLIVYSRLGNSPISLVLTGSVPVIARKSIIRNGSVTLLASAWPVDVTLASLGLNLVQGWVSSSSSNSADIVVLLVQGAYRQYYYNGSNWLRVGPNTVSNNTGISAGSGLIIGRKSLASGYSALTEDLPYSL